MSALCMQAIVPFGDMIKILKKIKTVNKTSQDEMYVEAEEIDGAEAKRRILVRPTLWDDFGFAPSVYAELKINSEYTHVKIFKAAEYITLARLNCENPFFSTPQTLRQAQRLKSVLGSSAEIYKRAH